MASSSSSPSSLCIDGDWQALKSKFKQLRASMRSSSSSSTATQEVKAQLDELLAYFVAYFESSHRYEPSNVVQILSGSNCTPCQAGFMWIGAWRPSAAASLVESVMGVSAQGEIDEPLSDEQRSQLTRLRDRCSHAERILSQELAMEQMMLPDQGVVSSVMGNKASIKGMVRSKVCSLRDILGRADVLRVTVLRELHSLLLPLQAARCSSAAFELAFAMSAFPAKT